jgi:MFS family permease
MTFFLARLSRDALLRDPNFRCFWISATLNGFGGQISLFAIPLCAAVVLHASPAQMGTLAALEALPFALFSLPTGVWLDRSRKLPILLASKLAAALILAAIALAFRGGVLTMGWMYALAFLLGCTYVVGGSAEQVFLTNVIGRERIVVAQTHFATSDSAARLLGPGIAGVLVQLLSAPFAVLATAAAQLASIFSMGRIVAADPAPPPSPHHAVRDMLDGFGFIRRHAVLLPVACTVAAWQMLFAGYMALNILFATRTLGLSPGMLGMAQAAGGAGVLLSAVLMQPLNRRHGTGKTMLAGLVATTACFTLTAALPARPCGSAALGQAAYAVLLFLLDGGVMLFMLPYIALRQRHTPDQYLGRVNSTMRFLTVSVVPLGAASAGMLAEHHGIRAAQWCVAAAGLALTAVIFRRSPLPHLRQ